MVTQPQIIHIASTWGNLWGYPRLILERTPVGTPNLFAASLLPAILSVQHDGAKDSILTLLGTRPYMPIAHTNNR